MIELTTHGSPVEENTRDAFACVLGGNSTLHGTSILSYTSSVERVQCGMARGSARRQATSLVTRRNMQQVKPLVVLVFHSHTRPFDLKVWTKALTACLLSCDQGQSSCDQGQSSLPEEYQRCHAVSCIECFECLSDSTIPPQKTSDFFYRTFHGCSTQGRIQLETKYPYTFSCAMSYQSMTSGRGRIPYFRRI